jgi:ketosteroid isomerase-like protein
MNCVSARHGGLTKSDPARLSLRKHPGCRRCAAIGWVVAVLLGLQLPVAAAPQRKQAKEPAGRKSESARLPDDRAIDVAISEMLAAWQIGDAEMLHKYYADDVTVVSGAWEPPLVGWANFLRAYKAQRERIQGTAQLDRSNTFIKVNGNFAWVSYQWQFNAVVDGKASGVRGQTTLIFERRADRWLIIHNHTSIVAETGQPTPAPSPSTPKPSAKESSGAG